MNAIIRLMLAAAVGVGVVAGSAGALAQTGAFTYQGRLNDGAGPATGSYDLRFTAYDSATNGAALGSQTNSGTVVSNGLFTAVIDLGTGVFSGAARWLEIGVRTNGGADFTVLEPRHPITPTPYAITAQSLSGYTSGVFPPSSGSAAYIQNQTGSPQAAGLNISGDATIGGKLTANGANTFGGVNTFNNSSNSFVGSFTGDGTGLTNVTATRRLYYTSGNNQWVQGTYSAATPLYNRSLSFVKQSSSSRLRISYTDGFGVNSTLASGAGAIWEVKLDGASLSPTLSTVLSVTAANNNGSYSTTLFQPGTITGYAQGVFAGYHSLSVSVSPVPSWSPITAYTGWNASYLLEVEEIP